MIATTIKYMDDCLRDSDIKTHHLFALIGEPVKNIDPARQAGAVIKAIRDALLSDYGERADDIAFHLSDWSSDAAFITALHLWPEQFTADEIRQGVEAIIIHAPNHLAAAAALGGYPVQDVFGLGLKISANGD